MLGNVVLMQSDNAQSNISFEVQEPTASNLSTSSTDTLISLVYSLIHKISKIEAGEIKENIDTILKRSDDCDAELNCPEAVIKFIG